MQLAYIDLIAAALMGVGLAIMILGMFRTARAEGKEAKFFFVLIAVVGLFFGLTPFSYEPSRPISYFIWTMGAAMVAALIGAGFAVMFFHAQRTRAFIWQAATFLLLIGIPALGLWRMACLENSRYCLIQSALQ